MYLFLINICVTETEAKLRNAFLQISHDLILAVWAQRQAYSSCAEAGGPVTLCRHRMMWQSPTRPGRCRAEERTVLGGVGSEVCPGM